MKGLFVSLAVLLVTVCSFFMGENQVIASSYEHEDVHAEMLPVLMYHTFDDNPKFPDINTTPENFKAQLTLLKEHGYTTITSNELKLFLSGIIKLPEKSFMITIDDGFESVYNIAYPILKELGMNATLFVITSHIESGKRFGVPMVSWEQLKEMNDSCYIEIGNHTHDLHWRAGNNTPGKEAMITNLTKDEIEITDAQREKNIMNDLKIAHDLIEKNVGVAPTSLAYPYGAYDLVAERAVKKAGYTVNHTVIDGINYPDEGTEHIKRMNITNTVSAGELLEKMNAYLNR